MMRSIEAYPVTISGDDDRRKSSRTILPTLSPGRLMGNRSGSGQSGSTRSLASASRNPTLSNSPACLGEFKIMCAPVTYAAGGNARRTAPPETGRNSQYSITSTPVAIDTPWPYDAI